MYFGILYELKHSVGEGVLALRAFSLTVSVACALIVAFILAEIRMAMTLLSSQRWLLHI